MADGFISDKKDSKKNLIRGALKDLLLSGSYKEGDKLPSERELAQSLNVSRNVLREAIISLASEGLLEVRERQGIFVKGFSEYGMIDSLQSIQLLPADFVSYQLEARLIIEVPAARLAAMRRTSNDIRKLRECYDKFLAAPHGTPEEQFQNGRWEALLHNLVTLAAHNPLISRLNESINSLVERNNILLHPSMLQEEGWLEKIKSQHLTIITAVEAGDQKLAGDTLEKHLIESVEIMLRRHPELITDIPSPYWSIGK